MKKAVGRSVGLFFSFCSYVMEDGSPYARTGKQNPPAASGRGTPGTRDAVEDLGDDVWNFMSFCKKDFVKDSVPDMQLSLQELTLRYKGELTNPCRGGLTARVEATNAINAAVADAKKSVLKTIAGMDLDKINMDLVENLLEWIVEGKHDYPPGTNPAEPGAARTAAAV